jgi:hypothetical protein
MILTPGKALLRYDIVNEVSADSEMMLMADEIAQYTRGGFV